MSQGEKQNRKKCASGSVGGARPCQGRGRGFESRLALLKSLESSGLFCYTEKKKKGEENMRKFFEEFKAFALRGNVMDMAVGVIIGGAFSGIVTSLTDNFINPILNVLTGVAVYSLEDVSGFASSFLSAVVNFVIMAFILFCLMKAVNKLTSLGAKKEETAEPTTKTCPYCMSEIDLHAVRCPHCTSILTEEK